MQKLYENFFIFHFQKIIVSVETISGNTVVHRDDFGPIVLGIEFLWVTCQVPIYQHQTEVHEIAFIVFIKKKLCILHLYV